MDRHSTILRFLAITILLFAAVAPAAADPPEGGKAKSAAAQSRARARKAGKGPRGKRGARKGKPSASRVEENGERAAEQPEGEVVLEEVAEQTEVGTVAGAIVGENEGEPTATGGGMRHSRHMEFDARLVRGETAGTGAVVLFDRGERRLPRLTRRRTHFLRATVEPVLGKQKAREPAAAAEDESKKKRSENAHPPAGEDGSGK